MRELPNLNEIPIIKRIMRAEISVKVKTEEEVKINDIAVSNAIPIRRGRGNAN